MLTTDHPVTICRENADGTETAIACLVQVTEQALHRYQSSCFSVDFVEAGNLPDGTTVELTPAEVAELDDAAAEIVKRSRDTTEANRLERFGI